MMGTMKPPLDGATTGSVAVMAQWWRDANVASEQRLHWQVAQETAVALLMNSQPVVVLMASPLDLCELAVGFMLSEAYVANTSDILGATQMRTGTGYAVDVGVRPGAILKHPARSMEARSGCGLCGLQNLTDVRRAPSLRLRRALDPAAVARAMRELHHHQPLNKINRSVHAAAFADASGEIQLVREDVGRHNALDKLIGAMANDAPRREQGFAVLTSRCSFELVQKAAVAGFSGLATLSAPTQLALETARAAGLPLASAAPDGIALFPCN